MSNAVESSHFGLLPGDVTSSEEEEASLRVMDKPVIPQPPTRRRGDKEPSRINSVPRAIGQWQRNNEAHDDEDQIVTRPPSAGQDVSDVSQTATDTNTATNQAATNQSGTILIFDWDDTLCPSTWLGQQNLTLDEHCVIPQEQAAKLAQMAEYTRRTLEVALQLGTVVIVTNAEEGWVDLSCRKFMPTLTDYLSNFRQLSARTKFEASSVSCPFVWKQMAFREEIYAHFEKAAHAKKSIISIGDSAHERLAVISITRTLPVASDGYYRMTGPISDLPPSPAFIQTWGNCRTKSVKFIERPAIEELMQEHELISSMLHQVAARDDDLDLCIRSIPTPAPPENNNTTAYTTPAATSQKQQQQQAPPHNQATWRGGKDHFSD